MKNDVLSNEEIAALVEAARQGNVRPTEEAPAPRRRAKRVRDIDFSRPNKFAIDQLRRLERAHEACCRTIGSRLSTELLTPVELDVLEIDQLTWSLATNQIPQPSVCGVIECRPLGTQVLLTAELGLMLRLVERLLGSTASTKTRPRELTEIEAALVSRMFNALLEHLSATWAELVETTMELRQIESQLANVNLAPPSEPTLMLTMEVRLDGTSSTIALVVPHRSVESVLGKLSASQYGDTVIEPGAVEAMRASVAAVNVEIRAEVAATELTLEDVLALTPGDVLRFGVPAADGVRLYAGRVPAHRAQPGRNGNNRAVQVIGRLGEAT
jgi:flagellar motor switch protein FliM